MRRMIDIHQKIINHFIFGIATVARVNLEEIRNFTGTGAKLGAPSCTIPGFEPPHCNETCAAFTFGKDCRENCSPTCGGDGYCDHVTGYCTEGCQEGYEWLFARDCSKPCQIGYYGYKCSQPCSKHCSGNGHCDHIIGVCKDGCKLSYRNFRTAFICRPDCPARKYGERCKKICNKNCGGVGDCHRNNGTCKNGCKDGFYGFQCNCVCLDRCKRSGACHRTTGRCDVDCDAGYLPPHCDVQCEGHRFGVNCLHICSECLPDNSTGKPACNPFNGTCIYGDVIGDLGDQTDLDDNDIEDDAFFGRSFQMHKVFLITLISSAVCLTLGLILAMTLTRKRTVIRHVMFKNQKDRKTGKVKSRSGARDEDTDSDEDEETEKTDKSHVTSSARSTSSAEDETTSAKVTSWETKTSSSNSEASSEGEETETTVVNSESGWSLLISETTENWTTTECESSSS